MLVLNVVVGCLCIITICAICIFVKWMCELLEETDEQVDVKIKLFDGGKMPEFKRKGDACLDCKSRNCMTIPKGQRALVPLGFAIELPKDYEAIVRPRSGNTKDGIDISEWGRSE